MGADTGGSILAARMAGVLGFLIAGALLMLLGFMFGWGGHGREWYLYASMSPFWGIVGCDAVLLAWGYWGLLGAGACLSDVGLFKYLFRAGMGVSYAGVVWLSVARGLPPELEWMWVAVYVAIQLVLWMVHLKLAGTSALRIGRKGVKDKSACWHCGYDLRGTGWTSQCPECGGRRL